MGRAIRVNTSPTVALPSASSTEFNPASTGTVRGRPDGADRRRRGSPTVLRVRVSRARLAETVDFPSLPIALVTANISAVGAVTCSKFIRSSRYVSASMLPGCVSATVPVAPSGVVGIRPSTRKPRRSGSSSVERGRFSAASRIKAAATASSRPAINPTRMPTLRRGGHTWGSVGAGHDDRVLRGQRLDRQQLSLLGQERRIERRAAGLTNGRRSSRSRAS